MDNEDFDGIMAALGDSIAYAKGDEGRARVVAGPDVKAIRKRAAMTQAQFSEVYRVPIGTLRDWEQGRRSPEALATTMLRMIQVDPKGVEKILAKVPV